MCSSLKGNEEIFFKSIFENFQEFYSLFLLSSLKFEKITLDLKTGHESFQHVHVKHCFFFFHAAMCEII